MTTRKHDEFLDIASDEDEASDRGYDSEEIVGGSKSRAVKRRRTADTQDFFGLDSDEDESADEEEESRAEIKGKSQIRKKPKTRQVNASDEDEDEDGDKDDDGGAYLDATESPSFKSKEPKKKPLSTKPLKPTKKSKTSKPGVVYLSSLPPYLKPYSLKNLIEARGFAPITKIFLAPLVPSNAGQKKRSNKRKIYTEGWAEFASKKTAKLCAETLNAQIIGGKKGGYYHDDIFNMKYLRGYKWDDLNESIQRERSEREARQRIEDARARKEEKIFLAGVEAGRVADGMARKNEEKRRRLLAEADAAGAVEEKKPLPPVKRRFAQNDVVKKKDEGVIGDDAKRVLGKIF